MPQKWVGLTVYVFKYMYTVCVHKVRSYFILLAMALTAAIV